jgi:hypothetical protein
MGQRTASVVVVLVLCIVAAQLFPCDRGFGVRGRRHR